MNRHLFQYFIKYGQSGAMVRTVALLRQIKRQQLRDAVNLVTGQPLEEIGEIPKRLVAIYPGGFNDGIDRRRGAPAPLGTHEQIILAATGERSDRSFHRVVVDRQHAVFCVAGQRLPVRERIVKRVAERTAWQQGRIVPVEPGLEAGQDRDGL